MLVVVVAGLGLGRVLVCLVIPRVPRRLEMEVFVPPIMLLGERLSASVSAAAGAGRLAYAPPQLWTVGPLRLGIRWSPLWVSVGCFLHVGVDCCLHVEVGEVILPMVALRLSLG